MVSKGELYNLGRQYYYGEGVEADHEMAVQLFTQAAEKGSARALYRLGRCYQRGLGVEPDSDRAIEYLKQAAVCEIPRAMLQLGRMYLHGDGVEENEQLGLQFMEQASDCGDVGATYELGIHYNVKFLNENSKKNGEDAAQDQDTASSADQKPSESNEVAAQSGNSRRAFQMFEKAANMQDVTATFLMIRCLHLGVGVEKDDERAAEFLKEAAATFKPERLHQIALRLLIDMETVTWAREEVALRLLEKAAERGCSGAMVELGSGYQSGEFVAQDLGEAKRFFEQAVALEEPEAMQSLGMMYINGNGVPRDGQRGVELLERSVEHGNTGALFPLAFQFDEGHAVEQDMGRAIELYLRGEDNPDCLERMGRLYTVGRGVEKDIEKAIEFYEKAAALGSEIAVLNLGSFFASHDVRYRDVARAFEFLERSIECGDPRGKYELAKLLVEERTGEVEMKRAFKLFEEAAAAGFVPALVELGVCHYCGIGTEENEERAMYIYLQAADLGDRKAWSFVNNTSSIAVNARVSK